MFCLLECGTVRKNILAERQLKAGGQQIPETGDCLKLYVLANSTCKPRQLVRVGKDKNIDPLTNHHRRTKTSAVIKEIVPSVERGDRCYISSNATVLLQPNIITE